MQNKGVHLRRMDVRQHNRRLLLQLLRSEGALSRAQLATRSGLSPAAVTNVIAELIELNLVQERGQAPESRLGRPATLVSLSQHQAVLCMLIGSGFIQVGVADLEANLLASESVTFELPTSPEPVLERAAAMVRAAAAKAGVRLDQVRGMGVGVAGIVDAGQRVNLSSNNLGWTDVPIADYFEQALGVAVVVDHNVRAMAMGEVRYGQGRGLESLAFIYLRSGVGAGLVLGGAEYRGGTHGAVELGHMRVVPGGLVCKCGGRGCLETVATDAIIRSQLLSGIFASDPAAVEAVMSEDWKGWFIRSVESGDAHAIRVRDELVNNLASALLSLINLLNPQRIVLGGLLWDLRDIVLEPLRASIPPQLMPLIRDSVDIQPATFGSEAGLIGAATVALDHYVFGGPVLGLSKAG